MKNDLERLLDREITTDEYVRLLNDRAEKAVAIYRDTAKRREGRRISFPVPRWKP